MSILARRSGGRMKAGERLVGRRLERAPVALGRQAKPMSVERQQKRNNSDQLNKNAMHHRQSWRMTSSELLIS
jgi:hypothetical protein